MAEKEPVAEKSIVGVTSYSGYGAPPPRWGSGAWAPGGGAYVLAGNGASGRPPARHVAVWCLAGWRTVLLRRRNHAQRQKPRAQLALCVISVAVPGLDLVVEGDAAKVSDETKLHRVADVYASNTTGIQPCATPPFTPSTGRRARVRPRGRCTKSLPRRSSAWAPPSRTARPAGASSEEALRGGKKSRSSKSWMMRACNLTSSHSARCTPSQPESPSFLHRWRVDGHDTPTQREQGPGHLLNALGVELRRGPATA